MAWRSHGTSNATLVEKLYSNGLLRTPSARSAFHSVDRAHYSPGDPYQDSPQYIGYKATISAPHMHAKAVESLLPWILPFPSPPDNIDKNGVWEDYVNSQGLQGKPGRRRRILDIGSGSGYLTHVLAELALNSDGPGVAPSLPLVVGLEHIQQLRDMGEQNVGKSSRGRQLLDQGIVRFRLGDGRKGWVEADEDEEEGGWDAIHVGAGAKELHNELVRQLRSPGRMFIPVDQPDGESGQRIWVVSKDAEGNVKNEPGFYVRYVPLTDAPACPEM